MGRTLWKSTHLKGSSVCMFFIEVVRTYLNKRLFCLLAFFLRHTNSVYTVFLLIL